MLSKPGPVTLLLVLTGVTGLIDAVSYLRLGHVFVANMTGNVVFLGLSFYPGSGLDPLASAVAIVAFLAGALAGGRLATHVTDRRRWLVVAFAVQAAVLALVAVGMAVDVLPDLATLVPLAAAFGLQNATVRRLAVRDLTTTVLTQTLTGLAADSVLAGSDGQNSTRRVWSVVVMFAGAAIGALLLRVTAAGVVALAAVLVLLVCVGFARTPERALSGR